MINGLSVYTSRRIPRKLSIEQYSHNSSLWTHSVLSVATVSEGQQTNDGPRSLATHHCLLVTFNAQATPAPTVAKAGRRKSNPYFPQGHGNTEVPICHAINDGEKRFSLGGGGTTRLKRLLLGFPLLLSVINTSLGRYFYTTVLL
jgi:hypothetical protein